MVVGVVLIVCGLVAAFGVLVGLRHLLEAGLRILSDGWRQ